MPATFGIVDLFAGPGGLGEGFAAFQDDGHSPFHIGISVEKEASAHRTLRLRAFLRAHALRQGGLPEAFLKLHAGRTGEPDWSAIDALAWSEAAAEARCLELGGDPAAEAIDDTISRLRRTFDDTILIGGPPCQAYSLVGRARSRGKVDYVPEEDHRHYLFREYIRVLDRLRPAVFVMENVKGMLSSTVESRLVFEMLMEELASLGTGHGHHYELRAIRLADGKATLQEAAQPSDFIVRAEEFGVPQRRHRVIIVGLRSDLAARATGAGISVTPTIRTVEGTIGTLAPLRSGVSKATDSAEDWRREVRLAAMRLADLHTGDTEDDLRTAFHELSAQLKAGGHANRASTDLPQGYGESNDPLLRWLERPDLHALAQHETRGHMASDLGRYLFAAVFGQQRRTSPKAADFPAALSPDHRSWDSGVLISTES